MFHYSLLVIGALLQLFHSTYLYIKQHFYNHSDADELEGSGHQGTKRNNSYRVAIRNTRQRLLFGIQMGRPPGISHWKDGSRHYYYCHGNNNQAIGFHNL